MFLFFDMLWLRSHCFFVTLTQSWLWLWFLKIHNHNHNPSTREKNTITIMIVSFWITQSQSQSHSQSWLRAQPCLLLNDLNKKLFNYFLVESFNLIKIILSFFGTPFWDGIWSRFCRFWLTFGLPIGDHFGNFLGTLFGRPFFGRTAPMQRGARFFWRRSALMQRGARFWIVICFSC